VTFSLAVMGVVAAMTILYAHAALREERKLTQSVLAPQYVAYRRRTGFLTPRVAIGWRLHDRWMHLGPRTRAARMAESNRYASDGTEAHDLRGEDPPASP
jgi:hypothetical protein